MLTAQATIAIDNATLFSQLQQHSTELEVAVKSATYDLRESRDSLEAILNNSPDAVLLLSPDGRIEKPNAAVNKLFGRDPDELYGQVVSNLLEPDMAGAIGEYFEKIPTEKQATTLEGNGHNQDGSSFDAEVILAPIVHGSTVTAVVCTIRDVTAWQNLQRMKDAFVSNVSHELRTPITSLRLNYSLLKRDPDNPDKYMDRLDREIYRLNDLIEDLLRLSQLDSDSVQLKLETVDLNELTAATVQDRSPLAVANQLELTHKPEPEAPQIYADGSLLAQALSVILTNALNYTPAGGHIEVGVVCKTNEIDEGVGFYVQDDGLGIPAEDQSHLFERFYRGTVGRASGAPGTGLGLAIAHEIVQRHHGHIHVESQGVPGEGTRFTIWLPQLEVDNDRV
jgi:two-component system phosphate regulon sensor histidine kinase PhoR